MRRPPAAAAIFSATSSAARQAEGKDRALARLAPHRHVAAHHARELAGDVKAEPRAALGTTLASSKPAASTFFKISAMRADDPRSTEFSVKSSGLTFLSRSTMSTK